MATGATFQNIFFPFNNPSVISGCQLWLDGADPAGTGILPANGATVSTWVDKSVNGYNATAAPSRTAGTYSTSFRAVNFPTSTTGYITNYSAAPTNETMFVVFNNPSASYDNNILIGGVQGARSLGAGYSGNGGNTVGVVGNLNTQVAWLARTDGGSYTLGTTALVTSQFTTSTNTISLNGGTAASGGAPGFTAGRVTYLGVDATNGSFYYVGYAMEIIFYNSLLNTTECQQVEGYLAWKWGLQGNLPPTHPYKNAAPNGAAPTLNSSQVGTIPLSIQKYSAFIPTQISGLGLWLDAADSTTITIATGVSQLNDKSTNAYNLTQATTGLQPSYSANLITFSSNKYLNIPQAAINNTATYSLFLVFNPIASTNWILQKQFDGNSTRTMLSMTRYWQNNTGTTNYLYWTAYANGGAIANSATALSTSTLQLVELVYDGSTLTMYRNGTVLSTTSSASYGISNVTNATSFTFGSWIEGGIIIDNGVTNFQFGELLFYTTSLTVPQRQQIEGYLAWKWGLQANLPAGNPYLSYNNYYNAFPTTTPAKTISISSIFKPTNYAGCQLWLDAFDPFGNGSRQKSPLTLTRWVDKSSSARHANMFNGSSISYSPTAFNNRPALLFTQTQNMSSAAAAGTFSSAFTFFIIYQRMSGGTYDTLVTRTVSNLAAPTDFHTVVSSGNFARNIGNGSAYSSYNTTSGSNFTNVTTPSLYYANVTAANGVLDAFNFATPTDPSSGILTGVYYADNGTAIYIGTRADSVTTLTASVAEVIVYSTTPTDIQRQTIEGYLAWKWGLVASLPAGHPYKNYPPPPQ